MMDLHEINKETHLSSNAPPFHNHKLIVSNLFSNKCASNDTKNNSQSQLTVYFTFDKCRPSSDHLTKLTFIASTKIASSALQNHNLGQNLNPDPSATQEPTKSEALSRPLFQPFKHSVTQVPCTLKESYYNQSGQSQDVSNRPSFDYSQANASPREICFVQPPKALNLKPVDYSQTTMASTQFSTIS